MFLFDLSIAMGIPVHELREWPITALDEYRAFSLLRPFSKRSDHVLQGLLIELIRNQNITKKHQYKSASELVPFLKDGLPEFLEHELIKKARQLICVARTQNAKEDVLKHIRETIDQELEKEVPDKYLITELVKILNENENEKNE